MKKCQEHANGKPCTQVIAEGNCQKEKCRLFPKVLRMIPKFKKLRELEAQGVFLTTLWGISDQLDPKIERRKKKAKKWLEELYPKIRENLDLNGGERAK